MNRVSQVIGAVIGMLGLYEIWMVLPLLPPLISEPILVAWAMVGLWLLIGAIMLLVAYGAIFRQTERDLKILTYIAILLILMFTDDIVTPQLKRWGPVDDPKYVREFVVSIISIVLSIIAYQVLKRTTWKKSVT